MKKEHQILVVRVDALVLFINETISVFKNLMKMIINYENLFNDMRKGFTSLNLKLKELFKMLDCSNLGFFTNNDLIIYL